MKKIFSFLILILSLYACDSSQSQLISGKPNEILSIELYNKIQSQYDEISDFENGTAIVLKGDCYGLINLRGKEILPCVYNEIRAFDNGVRIIVNNNKYGFADIKGKVIVDCIYDETRSPYYKYIPFKRNSKWGFVDKKGDIVIPFKYDHISQLTDSIIVAQYNDKFGIIDYNEAKIIDFEYDKIVYRAFMGSKISFCESNNKIGIINSQNKIVTDCIYDEWSIPTGEYVVLTKGMSNNYDTAVYGMINWETGREIIPFVFQNLGNYSEGLIMAKQNDKYGYLDIDNNVVIPFVYDGGEDFSEGKALIYLYKGYANTIAGRVPVKKCRYINTKGEIVIPIQFADQSFNDSKFSEGFAAIGIGIRNIYATKFGYIDTTGKFVIAPFFQKANSFKNGLAQVKVSDKIGYIDRQGNYIIQCIYDNDQSYMVDDSTICLEKDNKVYYFDYKGNKKY